MKSGGPKKKFPALGAGICAPPPLIICFLRPWRGICYGNVAGWVTVTRRYWIKTAKPILKLFRPSF